MDIEIKTLQKKDYKKAIHFAIKGMHFGIYFSNGFMTCLYGKYFLYSEMLQATQIIAAYHREELAGLLISRVKGEKTCFHSPGKSLYVKTMELIQRLFFRSSAGEYDTTCQEMLAEYQQSHCPDGEIIFLAADPGSPIKGIGTRLLEEYEKRERGRLVYLYTDDQCTYQFYEHRGFQRICEKDIVLSLKKSIPLKCMLYSKNIPIGEDPEK